MNEDLKQKLAPAAACLICAIMARNYGVGLAGTEFSGGRVTGPLLDLYDIGLLLFVLALLLTFFLRRVAAATCIAASLLCLPLYLYFVAPGPFPRVLGGTYSVPSEIRFRLGQTGEHRDSYPRHRRVRWPAQFPTSRRG